MKKQIALLIKSACFLALLCALMVAASYLFMPKNNHKTFGVNDAEMLARGILGEKENSIDVLVVGDSEAYSSISPMQMWEERGFRSYLCSTPAQPLYDSYRFLRQALDRQSPSVVVLETNAIFRPYKLNDYLLSRAKNLFSILRYHDRWKSLKVIDFGVARYFAPSKSPRTFAMVSPGFAPPEKYNRFDCDLRGDIYSLGATLYWALTKANLAKFKFNIPPLRQLKPDANHWLESVLAKCLQYAPERRYSSVDQVRDELINVRKELQGREGRAIDKTNALLERLYKQKYSSESL